MISFVGAGPGAADLITVRGAERLGAADVVVWASSLVPADVLEHCRLGIPIHDSATMTLEDVLAVYAAHDDDTAIVRLHSGDPSLYGAIQEQVDWCEARGRSWEIVPGVSSVSAAAAVAGRELTLPGVSQSVVATRLAGRTAASMPEGEGVAAFAAHGSTMAVLLSAARPDELQAELLAPGSAYRPETPAVIVVRATWPDQLVVTTAVGRLADDLKATGATMTALVLVGDALAPDTVASADALIPTATADASGAAASSAIDGASGSKVHATDVPGATADASGAAASTAAGASNSKVHPTDATPTTPADSDDPDVAPAEGTPTADGNGDGTSGSEVDPADGTMGADGDGEPNIDQAEGTPAGAGRRARRSHLYAPDYTTAYRLRSTPGTTTGRPSARRR